MGVNERNVVRFRFLIFVVILCLTFPSYVHSQCRKKPVIFIFGDSNSDTGGSVGLGLSFGPPNGRTFFRQPSGRVSDGRLSH
ncbi:hypothetical protein Dsin_025662 [Dipteronia sinensis]|uniref:GDSL esterase/lipase n=1 Tax=Dipteronia sinensis TaxID=43782 RepID=A0AAD9ZWS1_9ROSI|nr:hypothetical protein Dsin_025662 [Dipteronia sinensis]